MNSIQDDLETVIQDLLSRGFRACWISELEIGDIFADPGMFHYSNVQKMPTLLVADRFYEEPRYSVLNMIVYDEKDLERHMSFGMTHNVYIWRP